MSKTKKIIIGIIVVAIILLAGYLMLFKKPAEKITGYTTIEDFSVVENAKKDEIVMVTFGRETCSWCKKFKEVLNSVAEEKQVNLYYMDAPMIDDEHNYTIPLKCADELDQKLLDGFGTPLTIFFKNGEPVNCISVYFEDISLKSTLRNNKIIK